LPHLPLSPCSSSSSSTRLGAVKLSASSKVAAGSGGSSGGRPWPRTNCKAPLKKQLSAAAAASVGGAAAAAPPTTLARHQHEPGASKKVYCSGNHLLETKALNDDTLEAKNVRSSKRSVSLSLITRSNFLVRTSAWAVTASAAGG
jgi:hypothetical protein